MGHRPTTVLFLARNRLAFSAQCRVFLKGILKPFHIAMLYFNLFFILSEDLRTLLSTW